MRACVGRLLESASNVLDVLNRRKRKALHWWQLDRSYLTMPHTTCSVCLHEAHEVIDSLLLSGGSIREVAKRFGVSPAAVHRHQHHSDREKNRINTGEIARINAEIRKLHLAQTNAR